MNWVERNPKQIESLRTFISEFQSVKPGVLSHFQGGSGKILFPMPPESDRGVALLLCFCALHQNISEMRVIQLLAHLWDAYGTDLFKLNRMPFQDLQNKLQDFKGLDDWDLLTKVPGILRSVCDFFYQHGALVPWVHSVGDAEASVQILAEEIFMMGKSSQFKSKPRYFMWLLTQIPGAQPEKFWNDEMKLPITSGHIRLLREFGPLKNKRNSPWITAEEKLSYCNRFYCMLFPGKSWMIYTAMDAYLKATAPMVNALASNSQDKMWRCRQVLNGCINCILAPECPGREDV